MKPLFSIISTSVLAMILHSTAQALPVGQYDTAFTDQARIIAGMRPLDTARYAKVLATKAFKTHEQLFEESWKLFLKRAEKMEAWRDANLANLETKSKTLFYPFSGPDFLNADIFFPLFKRTFLG